MLRVLSPFSRQVSRLCQSRMLLFPWEFRKTGWTFVSTSQPSNHKFVNISFSMPDHREVPVKAEVGQTFLDIVLDNNVDIDGYGACEGTLACSTCHLIFTPDDYNRIAEEQRETTDDEEDMLDLAQGRTDESRLGCQVKVAEWMDGHKITVPVSFDARLGF